MTFAPAALAVWEPSQRYPDPAVQSLDPSFNKYRLALAGVERLATGCRFNEGAVYFGDARCLLWSDIPNNRIMRWDEETGRITIFRQPSNHANGNTRDRQGRLITCEHSGRRITRTEYDGTTAVLIDRFDGKRLNGTNDVVVKSDDTIWFTDPPSGISGNYLGVEAKPELPFDVYRLDPKSGVATVATTGLVKRPNGLAFSPDESKLYVIESAAEGRSIYVFDVVDGGAKLANGRIFQRKRRNARRLSGRRRRQFVVWLGHEPDARRREGVQSGRQGDRLHSAARARRQRLLRRPLSQPAVHGGEPLDLFALREHAGRSWRVSTKARISWSSGALPKDDLSFFRRLRQSLCD
jgi:gluconolactonase